MGRRRPSTSNRWASSSGANPCSRPGWTVLASTTWRPASSRAVVVSWSTIWWRARCSAPSSWRWLPPSWLPGIAQRGRPLAASNSPARSYSAARLSCVRSPLTTRPSAPQAASSDRAARRHTTGWARPASADRWSRGARPKPVSPMCMSETVAKRPRNRPGGAGNVRSLVAGRPSIATAWAVSSSSPSSTAAPTPSRTLDQRGPGADRQGVVPVVLGADDELDRGRLDGEDFDPGVGGAPHAPKRVASVAASRSRSETLTRWRSSTCCSVLAACGMSCSAKKAATSAC